MMIECLKFPVNCVESVLYAVESIEGSSNKMLYQEDEFGSWITRVRESRVEELKKTIKSKVVQEQSY